MLQSASREYRLPTPPAHGPDGRLKTLAARSTQSLTSGLTFLVEGKIENGNIDNADGACELSASECGEIRAKSGKQTTPLGRPNF